MSEDSEDIVELHAIVKGLVQGVCFRASVQEHANNLKLTGWVRNCRDGSVELVAHGTNEQLERFLEILRARPGYGRIDSIDATYLALNTSYTGFHIKH